MLRAIPLCVVLLLSSVTYLHAGEGVLEINQACALSTGCFPGDTGGFPVTITQPGSYVLTGDLEHDPAAHPAIDIVTIAVDDVTLDLNGFSIRGTTTCQAGACPAGAVQGITGLSADRVTLRNGRIVGLDANCIRLGAEARVEDMAVSHCGFLGISVGANSIVQSCRVTSTGRTGLAAQTGTIYRDCTFARNGLRGETTLPDLMSSVGRNAKATGPNSCDDGKCASSRRFYLTRTTHDGANALTACALGFHMASLWEIFDTSHLHYDTALGDTTGDSGSGAPSAELGWTRTGIDGGGTAGGIANCNDWTVSISGQGTQAGLEENWEITSLGGPVSPWRGNGVSCDVRSRVWCIED